MLSMQKLKDMTDAELIRHLKESGIAHGPIVESTRTLYEKKLFEYERKKKSFASAAESSYESKQEYSSREYDANQGSLINVGGMAFGTHHSQQDHLNSLQEELPGTSYSNMRGARGARQKVGAGGAKRKKDIIETKEKIAAGVTRQKKTVVETKQKLGARMTRQKMTVVETVQKGVRAKRQMKDVGETTQLVYTSNPASDISATGSIVEAAQDPEIKVASLSTCRRGRAKYQRPPTPRRIQPALMGALEIEKQPEENSNHFLAMSLVPLLDKVPEEKMVALRHDLLNLITSYSMDTPPKLPRFSGIAFSPSDKHY